MEKILDNLKSINNKYERWVCFYKFIINYFNGKYEKITVSDMFFLLKENEILEYKEMTIFFARAQLLLLIQQGIDVNDKKFTT